LLPTSPFGSGIPAHSSNITEQYKKSTHSSKTAWLKSTASTSQEIEDCFRCAGFGECIYFRNWGISWKAELDREIRIDTAILRAVNIETRNMAASVPVFSVPVELFPKAII